MRSGKPLVLVVDDESHIVHVIQLKLENAGFDVVTARDGEEALALATSARPDVVITDMQMPYIDGRELCKRLEADTTTRGIPAMIITAHGFALTDVDRELTNIQTVVNKPFSPRELVTNVHAMIAGKTVTAGANTGDNNA